MRVTKLLIFPVKIRIFCPRTTEYGLKLAFWPGLVSSFGALLVGSLVVVAQDTYLLYLVITKHLKVQFEPPVSEEKVYVCDFFAYDIRAERPRRKVRS